MKRELLTDEELDQVTGGNNNPQVLAKNERKFSSPAWLDDLKRDKNPAEFVPINSGNFIQKLKGIFQRMQLD
jgi:bacteriocin-like protein